MNVRDDADKTAMSTKVIFSSSGKGKITAAITREDSFRVEVEKELEAGEELIVAVGDESVRETPQLRANDATAGKAEWLVKHVMPQLMRLGFKAVFSEGLSKLWGFLLAIGTHVEEADGE